MLAGSVSYIYSNFNIFSSLWQWHKKLPSICTISIRITINRKNERLQATLSATPLNHISSLIQKPKCIWDWEAKFQKVLYRPFFHFKRISHSTPCIQNIKIYSEWCLTDHISTLEAAVGNPGTYYFSELFYQGVTDAPQRRVAKTHRDASWSVMTHQRLLPC